MWKLWLHVALLCVMLVVVGIMTRCAIQVVSCTHGHLDMMMGNHGAMQGVDFWSWCSCMAYLMHIDAVKTHTQHGCIPIVLLH